MRVGFIMDLEKQLIEKNYYQILTGTGKPIDALRTLNKSWSGFHRNNQKEQLIKVRMAQGELSYHLGDYETAVFKWEKVTGDFKSWALKNIGDTYTILEEYQTAEEMYRSISTESHSLIMERLLSLISLYEKQNKLDKALMHVKEAVELDPDYPNVSEIALNFYKKMEDWNSAVTFIVDQLNRTKSYEWVIFLGTYVREGLLDQVPPSTIVASFDVLKELDPNMLETLMVQLWDYYHKTPEYLPWLEAVNQWISEMEINRSQPVTTLLGKLEATFEALTSGEFLLGSVREVTPKLLINWMELSFGSIEHSTKASSALLAWYKKFPEDLDDIYVNSANRLLQKASRSEIEAYSSIKDTIYQWTESKGFRINKYTKAAIDFNLDFTENETDENDRMKNLISNYNEALTHLYDEPERKRKELNQKIKDNQRKVKRLEEKVTDLEYVKREMATWLIQSFQKYKGTMVEDIEEKIPPLLQRCSQMIHLESNYKSLHLELNDEMNRLLEQYMYFQGVLSFSNYLEKWVAESKQILVKYPKKEKEICDEINTLFEEPVLSQQNLSADEMANEWKQVVTKLVNQIQFSKIEVLGKTDPMQSFLKGVGKLLGSLNHSNSLLCEHYQKYIENETYDKAIKDVTVLFLKPFDSFEQTIVKKIDGLFEETLTDMASLISQLKTEVRQQAADLKKFTTEPEVFSGAIDLIGIKVSQQEALLEATQSNSHNKQLQ